MFSNQTIAAFAVSGLLSIIIPIAALIFYKRKNKSVPISPFFIGCAAFFLFALVLEQLLHTVMLPIVQNSTVLYVIYGTLAAGIFEETARFISFKTVMKKHADPKASIVYGIGHGGFEAIVLMGITMLSYISLAVMTNQIGAEAVAEMSSGGDPAVKELAIAQLNAMAQTTLAQGLISVFERILAMTLHISLSVVVFAAARTKGRVWLYPAAIIAHALFDVPVALYQRGVGNQAVMYVLLTAATAATVIWAVKIYKSIPFTEENLSEN